MDVPRSKQLRAPSRQFGWLLVIVAFTTFATLLKLETPQAPAIGAGGYLGALTTTWLNKHFAMVGSFILTSAVMVAGLLLSTDYVVLRWMGWLMREGAALAGNTAAVAGSRGLSNLNPLAAYAARLRRSDVDEGVALPGDSIDNVSIRNRGQQIDGKTLPSTTAVAASPTNASGAVAATSAAATKATGKAADSIIAGVAAGASNLLNGKLKPESAAEEADETEASEDEEEITDEAEAGEEATAATDEEAEATDDAARQTQEEASAAKKADDSLEHLDDTSLPEGTEEYVLPGVDLLTESDDINFEDQAVEVRRKAKILEKTFGDFGFNVRVVEIETGQ